jgi:hypothetical protein
MRCFDFRTRLTTGDRDMKFTGIVIISCILALGLIGTVHAQDTGKRTDELVAALDKTKSKSKEKRGLKIEVYVDVKNEAVAKQNVADYSGTYTDENDMHRLLLNVSSDGRVLGSGYDDEEEGKRQSFTLRDARIDGALLTATKIYANGSTEKLEAVFANRRVRSGTNEKSATETEAAFGVGYVHTIDSMTTRFFLKKQ